MLNLTENSPAVPRPVAKPQRQTSTTDYSRLKLLMDARADNAERRVAVETQISRQLLSMDILEVDGTVRLYAHHSVADLTPFQATEALSDVLDTYLPSNKKRRYDPKLVDAAVVTDVWSLRQTIDSLGMPYDRYIDMAIAYIGKPHGRAPRLSQFRHVDVVTHVVTEWSKRS